MNKKPPVVINNQYGRLTVLSLAPAIPQSNGKYMDVAWNCSCTCGGQKIVTGNSLRHGLVKSCGCLRKKERSSMSAEKAKSYAAWAMLKRNCDKQDGPRYASIGALGITYPKHWENFEGFYTDMGDGEEGMFFTRSNLSLNFSKENCLWSSERPKSAREDSKQWVFPFKVDEGAVLDDVGSSLIKLDKEITVRIAEKIVRALNAGSLKC